MSVDQIETKPAGPAGPAGKTLEDVKKQRAFSELTPKMRFFVEDLITGGNAMESVERAYEPKTEQSKKCMVYELLANPRVQTLLDFYHGVDERERFNIDLKKKIERGHGKLSVAEFQTAKLFAELQGWSGPAFKAAVKAATAKAADLKAPISKPEPQTFSVGDIAFENGQKFTVLEVGPDGQPSKVEPFVGAE